MFNWFSDWLISKVSAAGDYCFSGGVDGIVRCWNIPPSSIDPYDTFDANAIFSEFEGEFLDARYFRRHFLKWQAPKGIFPSSNFPNVQFPNAFGKLPNTSF